jgi:hypothetical protein
MNAITLPNGQFIAVSAAQNIEAAKAALNAGK